MATFAANLRGRHRVNLANDKMHQRGYAISPILIPARGEQDPNGICERSFSQPQANIASLRRRKSTLNWRIVMSVHFDAPRAPTVFALPEESHAELVKLCGHLRLMAQRQVVTLACPISALARTQWRGVFRDWQRKLNQLLRPRGTQLSS